MSSSGSTAGVVDTARTFQTHQAFAAGVDLTGAGSQLNVNGQSFSKPYDTDIWVAGVQRLNPTLNSQAMYSQHRLSGDMGALTHDAAAMELRLSNITNASFLNALEATVVVTGGANTIPDARAFTNNLVWQGAPTGSITAFSLMRSQTISTPPAGMSVGTVYGLYVEPQTIGTTANWSVYAPTGASRFGALNIDSDSVLGTGTGTRQFKINGAAGSLSVLNLQTNGVDRWHFRRESSAETGSNAGSDLTIVARDDTGANLGTVVTFVRATRGIKFDTGPIGFYGTTPVAKPTISGSRGGNAALASLITSLASQGLITDGTSA